MDEALYNQRVAASFKRVLAAVDALDPDDLEADSTGDMLTLSNAKGEKCIVNTQRAVQQIWVAAQSQGIHFTYDDASGTWRDDKGKGFELFGFLTAAIHSLSGLSVKL